MSIWQYLAAGIGTTLTVWVGALALSVVLAVPVAAARRAEAPVFRFAGGLWAGLARGIPPLVWIIIVFYGVSIPLVQTSPALAAVIALGVVNSAYVGDAIRAGLDSVPRGQWEASSAVALSRWNTLFRVILPQAFPIMLATTTAYSITLLKNTALASIIGVSEMLYYTYNAVQLGADPLNAFLAAGIVYLAIALPVGLLARWFEGRSVIAAVR